MACCGCWDDWTATLPYSPGLLADGEDGPGHHGAWSRAFGVMPSDSAASAPPYLTSCFQEAHLAGGKVVNRAGQRQLAAVDDPPARGEGASWPIDQRTLDSTAAATRAAPASRGSTPFRPGPMS